MNDLNLVLLIGRLTRDPHLKEIKGGSVVCEFSVASNRYFRRETGGDWAEETSFLDITTWGLLARQCGEGLTKGQVVRIQGRIRQERWQDGAGINRAKIVIVAEKVEWPAPRRADDDDVEDAEPAPHELQPELAD